MPDRQVVLGDLVPRGEEDQQQAAVPDDPVGPDFFHIVRDRREQFGGVSLERPSRLVLGDGLDLQPVGGLGVAGAAVVEEGALDRGVAQRGTLGGQGQVAAEPVALLAFVPVAWVALLGPDAVARAAEGVVDEGVEPQLGQRIKPVDRVLRVVFQGPTRQPGMYGLGDVGGGPFQNRWPSHPLLGHFCIMTCVGLSDPRRL